LRHNIPYTQQGNPGKQKRRGKAKMPTFQTLIKMATSKAVNIRQEKTERERRGTRTKDLPTPSSFSQNEKRNRTQLRLLKITLRAQKLRAAAVLHGKPSHRLWPLTSERF
jgi:hypothetical protein